MKRPFQSGALNHCYQRSADGGVIFYSVSDYLVWFSIVCITASKHQVSILALCPMPDHIHMSVVSDSVQQLSAFMGEVNRTFSHAKNQLCNTKLSWFERTYGSVFKKGEKAVRTNLIYVGNNPVERHLAARAEDYRWTFLAYAGCKNPFSEKLVLHNSSWHLKNAVGEIRTQYKHHKPMNYSLLKRITEKLNAKEIQQLIDYIISTYNVIDYDKTLSYFDNSYDNYLTALHSTTGSEYDLKETFVGWSDAHYNKMIKVLLKAEAVKEIHEFLSWPESKRNELFSLLKRKTNASAVQIKKFLHLPLD